MRAPAAAPGQTPTRPPAAAAAATAQAPAAGPVWTVARYDTFWGIADKTLGDGRRYQEIVELNVGVAQADGGAVRDSSTNLEIGWQLRLPTGADTTHAETSNRGAATVTVKPGNTLSEIAQDELGDATRYPELAALNNIPNPDVINVGDVIAIPAADPIPEQAAAPATLDV